ncbi:MAG: WD40 repeat domain-containing protein, partial [Acidobacteriota bacterium]
EVENERGALPLLAFAAARMWEKRDRETGLLTREAYEEIGGVGGALARHAEATIDRIGHERIPIVRELFRNLVTAEGTRAVREWDELLSVFGETDVGREGINPSPTKDGASAKHNVGAGVNPAHDAAEEVLRELIDARLLTSYEIRTEDEAPTRRIEIIHESLLANWPRLVRWNTQDQEGAQLRDELRQAARAWDEHGRHDDRLWTGMAHREFELWSERYPGGLSELESEFVVAMRSLANRRRRRRRLAIASAGAVLLATLAVITGLWRQSVHQTRVAEGSKLITLGHVAIDKSRTDALAYALAALEHADTTEARHLAVEALWAGPPATVLSRRGGTTDLAFSPDGEYLAVGSAGGTLAVHSRNGQVVFEQVDKSEMVYPVVEFSPDGRHLAFSPFMGAVVSLRESGSWGESATLRVPEARFGIGFFDADPESLSTIAYRGRGGTDPSANPHQIVVDRWSLQGELLQHTGSFDLPAPPSTPGQVIVDGPLGLIATAIGTEVQMHSIDSLALEPPRVLLRRPEPLRRVSMAFTPDGARLALCESDGRLSLLATADPGDPVVIEAPIGDPMGTAFSPDGSMLAQALDPSGVVTWDFEGPAGAGPLALDRRQALTLEFSPEGRWLAVAAGGQIELFPITTQFVRTLAGHDGPATSIAFARDGSVLFTQGATEPPPWRRCGRFTREADRRRRSISEI